MRLDLMTLIYVAGLLAALSVVSLFFEQRRRRFDPLRSNDNVFRCDKCGFVYTDDPDVDRSRCPQCGKPNEAVEF